MKRILLIDNYDSFTYNLALMVLELTGHRPEVFRNDQVDIDEIGTYDKILLSPGPGIPSEAGLMPAIISRYAPYKSILGICLGHQGIAEHFGAQLKNICPVYHGVATPVYIREQDKLFEGLSGEIAVGRYHSWIVDKADLPGDLVVTAEDQAGSIMALRHKQYNVYGIQFHPESILTPTGRTIMSNWINN